MEVADFQHVVHKYIDKVYEPSDDTFLLLDAIEKDAIELKKLRPLTVLEIGSGYGVVIASLAKFLGGNTFCLSTDINVDANLATIETSLKNKVSVEAVNTDLVNGLLPRLRGKIDVLLFNPPYVPTPDDEITKDKLSASWAGGLDGRKIMNRVFPSVDILLSPVGVFYLVAVQENNIDAIRAIMSSFNFNSEIVLSRKCRNEHLYVLKFRRKATTKT